MDNFITHDSVTVHQTVFRMITYLIIENKVLLIYFQEIIEFPVLMLNSSTLEVESIFHQYVLPTVHPELTGFCTEVLP